MKCKINDQLIPSSHITYRDMGFGEKILDEHVHRYFLILSIEEFIEIMRQPFDEFVKESKEDDELTGYSDDLGLLELDYPDFLKALKEHRAFLGYFIKDLLYHHFLDGCFTNNDKSQWQYVINSIDNILIFEEYVNVTGEVFKVFSEF